MNRLATQLTALSVIWPTAEEVWITLGGENKDTPAATRIRNAAKSAGATSTAGEKLPTVRRALRETFSRTKADYGPFLRLCLVSLYLSLPFGWNASPGNYNVFGHVMNSAHCHSGPPATEWWSAP